MTISNDSPAPKARNVKAWGNAPGDHRTRVRTLKARHEQLATELFRAYSASVLPHRVSWGVAQAFAFRTLGAFYPDRTRYSLISSALMLHAKLRITSDF